ncbi:hypothetical protein [uncultured Hymenobacter sp.]|uniref:hypothetical protein n=1 Tax=uncultured Hymenobacter sp. TaxID=170016 RepID=UPI0035CB20D2
MELKDLFLTPFYLVLLYLLAYAVRPRVTNKYTRPYFIPALTLKFVGAIGLGLIYQFYYGGGDTFNFFSGAKGIHLAFDKSFQAGLKLLLTSGKVYDPVTAPYTAGILWYQTGGAEYLLIRIAATLGFLCFNTYTVVGLLFACLSFSGVWMMYITFVKYRPQLYQQLAWAVFYLPSVFFWGSGLLKDSLCLGALGWVFYAFYKGAIQKRSIVQCVIIGLLAAYLLAGLKIYILLCFVPAALLWVFNENNARIKNPTARLLAKPVFFGLGLAVAFVAVTNLTKGNDQYDLNKIGERSKINSDYLYRVSVSQNGSAYNLGAQDGTVGGMVKLAPKAIGTSLFRPFLWEARNPVMLLSALEAAFFLVFTLRIFFRTGVIATIRLVAQTPLLTLCFVFALAFSASVAISSSNFGTLVRYKIPMMPFYLAGLYILESLARTPARPRPAAATAAARPSRPQLVPAG